MVTPEKIEYLYKIEKICTEEIKWGNIKNSINEHFVFQLPVITTDSEMLTWTGYYQYKYGKREYGFTLFFMNAYCVRSWDMAKRHWSVKEGRYIKGAGCHKHYHLNEKVPRDAYTIPMDEISMNDPNKAVIDFAKECNITIMKPYQQRIFLS